MYKSTHQYVRVVFNLKVYILGLYANNYILYTKLSYNILLCSDVFASLM